MDPPESVPTDDARCPECGEPVSATATYCLHCKADLDRGSASGAAATADTGAVPDDGASPSTGVGASQQDAAGRDRTGGRTAGGRSAEDGPDGWNPDGLLDDGLTFVVGAVGGFVVGLLAGIVLLMATMSGWALVLTPLVWLGATVQFARQRSVHEAVRQACYATALLLVVLPVLSFSGPVKGGTAVGRAVLFVVGEVILGPVALLVGGVGYWVGGRAPAQG